MARRIDWEAELRKSELGDYLQELPPTEAGRTLHNYLEQEYGDLEDLELEGEIYENGELQGRYDCLDEKAGVIYEFKTKSSDGMKSAPYQSDITQVREYLDGTSSEVGFLVYISREDLATESYPITRK
jgi:hypothetical protein